MRTNQFIDLKKTILGVQSGASRNLSESTEFYSKPQDQPQVQPELVEYVTDVIYATEETLGIQLSAEEINETANFIVGKLGVEAIIESIESKVGFELNENEINYVLGALNESL